MGAQKTLVVVGQGMVGYKLLECLVDNGATDHWRIVAFGEEPRAAYDRAIAAGGNAVERDELVRRRDALAG